MGGGPPAWEMHDRLTTPHHKKNQLVMKCYTGPQNWMDSLE
jgi:hypothetical protein